MKDASLIPEGSGMIHSILEAFTDPVCLRDKEGVILYCNRKFSDTFIPSGLSLEGKKSSEILSDSVAEVIERYDGECLSQKKSKLYNSMITQINGMDHEFEISKSLCYNLDNSVWAIITSFKTGRSKNGEQLKESEEKLKILFESIGEGIVVTDLNGIVTQVNEAFMIMHRFENRDQIVGKNAFDFVSRYYRKKILDLLGIEREDSYFGALECLINRPEGPALETEVSIAHIKDRDEKPTGYVILIKDITDRKGAESALRESEERNREILQSIPDMMFRINSRGEYLDNVLGSKVEKVFPEAIRKKALPIIEKAFDSGEIQIYEYPVYNKGEIDFYEARFIISGPDELLIILRNISERIVAEELLKKARDEAEAANQAKSDFLANMSHEIRTPLHSIHGFIELMKKTTLDNTQSQYLQIIQDSGDNLLGIIDDILDFSKIESNRMEIENLPFNPVVEFESVLQLFNYKAVDKRITLLSYIDPSLGTGIAGDSLRIKQVITNLLSNAVKFTPEDGTVYLEITTKEERGNACTVSYSVRDNGIGIPDEKQESIFQSFAQADSSVTRKYGGTGLGLSISQNLVSLMGGLLQLDSKKGVGSRFYFELDHKKAEVPDPLLLTFAENNPDVYFLVSAISDEYHELKENILRRYLESFHCRISLINEISALADKKPDAIIAVYGEETKERLHSLIDAKLNIPIVIVSHENMRRKMESIASDIDYILSQPVSPIRLFVTLVDIKGIEHDVKKLKREVHPGRGAIRFKARALVAEDHAMNQMFLAILLQEYGIETVGVSNGLDAYDAYTSGSFDIIFMDINMPVSDGIEATKMILGYEESESKAHVPIVALTARAQEGDRAELLKEGMDDYLAKPIDKKKFTGILLKYLSRKQVLDSNELPVPEKTVFTAPEGHDGYNIELVAQELMIKPESMKKIISRFFIVSDETIKQLQDFITSKDLEAIYQAAHKLKGAAQNIRLHNISDIALNIETAAMEKEDVNYIDLFLNLENEYKRIKEMLSKVI